MVVVPEGLAKDSRGRTLPEPSFVFRQVLDYVSKFATSDTDVYLAPANRFGGEIYEQEAAYAYLSHRAVCRRIHCPVFPGPGYVDTFGNALLLRRYLLDRKRWPPGPVDLVCADVHSYRAQYCFARSGYSLARVHRVPFRVCSGERVVDRLWYYRVRPAHLVYEISAMARDAIRGAVFRRGNRLPESAGKW
ncbi:MAG: hypothetical protein J4F39_09285 [Candidatus Latescibacteria bacterium]|nr:hypothetical protein [Candidatus Latescibacterota bacterium]